MILNNKVTATLFALLLGLTLTACGGGSSDSETNTNTNTNTSNHYDFSKYLFHTNVLRSNGEVSFMEKFYTKETGEQVLTPLDRKFTSADGTFIKEFTSNEVIKTYKINDNDITETIIKANASRSYKRFISVGDTILDADFTSALGDTSINQNATCIVLEHFDSYDLATAAANYNLASGVYNDVLKLECITSFVSNGIVSPHTKLRSYHAKNIGVIFAEGSLFFGGDVYITEEY